MTNLPRILGNLTLAAGLLLVAEICQGGTIRSVNHWEQNISPGVVREPPFFVPQFNARPANLVHVNASLEEVEVILWEAYDEIGGQLMWTVTPGTFALTETVPGAQATATIQATAIDGRQLDTVVTYFEELDSPIWGLVADLPTFPPLTLPGGSVWEVPVIGFAAPEPGTVALAGLLGCLLVCAWRVRRCT